MAAPVTHIVLANRVFTKEFSNFSKEKFFVGTSFPDIRYLGIIKRSKTHFTNPLLDSIKKENDTKAGIMFHSLVDVIREKFIEKSGIYKIISKNSISIQALKLLEDEVLYNQIRDWKSIASYFDSVLLEELTYLISKDSIEKWHSVLKRYFVKSPNAESRKILFKEINFSNEIVLKIEEKIVEMKKNGKVLDIINNFYDKFEDEIK